MARTMYGRSRWASPSKGTIDLDGHPTWMKDWGGDDPVLLLLHGGFVGTETNFETLIPYLEEGHRLIAFDRRGHGRTADSPEPFSYASMADETAAMIEHVGGPVRAVGYSDGGNLLLDLAQRRPELLESMVVIGANYHHDGLLPQVLPMFEAPDHRRVGEQRLRDRVARRRRSLEGGRGEGTGSGAYAADLHRGRPERNHHTHSRRSRGR